MNLQTNKQKLTTAMCLLKPPSFYFGISFTTVWPRAKPTEVTQSIKVGDDDRCTGDISFWSPSAPKVCPLNVSSWWAQANIFICKDKNLSKSMAFQYFLRMFLFEKLSF